MAIGQFDSLFTAQRLKLLFKNSKEDGPLDVFFNVIDWPLNLMRDLSIPAGSLERWNRTYMSFVPIFITIAFCLLFGLIEDFFDPIFNICLIVMIPGAIAGGLIFFKTKVSSPPEWLLTLSAMLCFVMSICWISFTSDLIVDLLGLFGKITGVT